MTASKADQAESTLQEGGILARAKAMLTGLGPGLITGASDDDPSTIGTMAQTGAQFGYTQLWTMLFTIPLMIVIQEMCARVALQTGESLTRVIRQHYARPIVYLCVLLLFVANTINLGADLGAMAAAGQLVLGVPFLAWLIAITLISIVLEVFVKYKNYSRILRVFALSLFAYVIVALVVPQNWSQVLSSTFIPIFRGDAKWLMNIVAILGTSYSPYMYFWQASEEVEEKIEAGQAETKVDQGKVVEQARPGISPRGLRWMRSDIVTGMVASNIITWFIIITSASTLGARGVHNVTSAVQAAESLKPVAGNLAYLLFAIGMIGIGLLAVPVLAGSIGYAAAGALNLQQGLFLKLLQAPGFYAIIAASTLLGAGMNLIGINPIQALYYVSVLNGLAAPPMLVMLMLVSNNRKIMGDQVNPGWSNLLGWVAVLAVSLGSLILIVALVTGQTS